MTLSESRSHTSLQYKHKQSDGLKWSFLFEGKDTPAFHPKIQAFLQAVEPLLPYLSRVELQIESRNTFPHSSGIASSASSMMSLACCLVDLGMKLYSIHPDPTGFFALSSYLARLGSGSASRSAWPGFALWGKTSLEGSNDEEAIAVNNRVHPWFNGLRDAILIVSSGKKGVSSSHGHGLMNTHPYAPARYKRADENLHLLLEAMKVKDQAAFSRIVENEALDLHGLMLSSDPGFTLIKPGTLSILEKIKEFREHTGIFMTYTLDAGPNVHLIYHQDNEPEVKEFTENSLRQHCESGRIVFDRMGTGPQKEE